MEKIDIMVRFANGEPNYSKININPNSIKNVIEFKDEVFFMVDDLTVAIKSEDWGMVKEIRDGKKI